MIYNNKEAKECIDLLKNNKEGFLFDEADIGFAGVGKAGSHMAFMFKDFAKTSYINTSSSDLSVFAEYNKKLCLKFGSAEGSGKIYELSKQMAEKDKDKINNFLFVTYGNIKILVIFYATGGGTGVGSAITIATNYEKYFKEQTGKGIDILLAPINATEYEGGLVAENEFKHAKEIIKAQDKFSFTVIDNNHIIGDKSSRDYEKVNQNVLLTFLRLFEKNKTYNNDRIDSTDMILSFKQKGYTYIATFNIDDKVSLEEQIKTEINKSVFFKPDFKVAKRINCVVNSKASIIDSFNEQKLRDLIENKRAVTITTQFYESDDNGTFAIAIFGTGINKTFIDKAFSKYNEYNEQAKASSNSIDVSLYETEEDEEDSIDDLKKIFDL